jgi:hypothetical protein
MLKLLNTKIRFVWVSLLFLFLSQFALADICHFSGFGGVDLGYPYSDSVSDQPQSGFSSPAQACDFLVPRTAYQQANPGGFTETGYLTITEVRLGEKYYPIKFSQPEYYQYNFYCFGTLSRRYSPPILVDSDVTGFRAGGSCSCGTVTQACHNTALILALTPAPNQKDPRPLKAEGKDGKSTLELIAKVMEGSTPKVGVAVTFKVDVVPMTGGHGHHDASRPKGEVVPNGNKTDSNGEIKLTFQASDVAGSHTITATCNDCTNKTVNKNVDVRVPDLQPLSPNPPQNAEGKYLYALTAKDPTHVGTSGGRQRGEYYLTAKAIDNLQALVTNFAAENWGIVAFNDASLVWGGLYDIDNDWMESHQGHRIGEEIDISFTRANNPISEEKRKRVYKTLCDAKKTSVPFKILYHTGGPAPHYHVYLMGRKSGCFTLPT